MATSSTSTSSAPAAATTTATTTGSGDASSSSSSSPSATTTTDIPIRSPAASTADSDSPPSSDAAIPATPTASTPNAAVPIETHFASREELLTYVHAFTVSHGYAVVIQKSNVPRGQVWLRCDLGGSYRNTLNLAPDARKRKCSSRLKNCPFQLYARRLPDSQWVLKIQNATHNHEVATETEQLVTHPVARRLTLEQKKFVDELTEMGARPALIVEKMKEKFPDKPIKVQDIYNTRNYIRRERSAGRVPFPELEAPLLAPSSGGAIEGSIRSATLPLTSSSSSPAAVSAAVSAAASDPTSAPSSSSASSSSGQASSESNAASKERLQGLLDDANDSFPSWSPRTQKQFLFQLEVLLGKCKKGTGQGTAGSSRYHPRTRGRQQPLQAERAAAAAGTTVIDDHGNFDDTMPPPPPLSPPHELSYLPPGSPLVDSSSVL